MNIESEFNTLNKLINSTNSLIVLSENNLNDIYNDILKYDNDDLLIAIPKVASDNDLNNIINIDYWNNIRFKIFKYFKKYKKIYYSNFLFDSSQIINSIQINDIKQIWNDKNLTICLDTNTNINLDIFDNTKDIIIIQCDIDKCDISPYKFFIVINNPLFAYQIFVRGFRVIDIYKLL